MVMPLVILLQNGQSPLHIASFNGHLNIVETLIEAGANIYQINKVHVKHTKCKREHTVCMWNTFVI